MQNAANVGNGDLTLKQMAAVARGDAMMSACRGGHDGLLDDLLQAGVDPSEKNETTGDAPLHVSSTLGHAGVVRSLLREGAARDGRDSRGRAPLHLAAEHGHVAVVRTLLAAGAAVNLLSFNDSLSALVFACRGGHLNAVTTLIEHGADVGACSLRHPYTALQEAAIGNHPQCITALVEAGADIEALGSHGRWKRTPLQLAAGSGSAEAVSTLLRHGAAKDARDKSFIRNAPLHLAITQGHAAVVEALLSADAEVNPCDSHGEGYVSVAARTGDVDVLKLLIGHGADVSAVSSSSGRRALHVAAANNMVRVIDALVEAGADLGAQDARGKTPLHCAMEDDDSCEALVALLRHGCDMDKADSEGRTPLHVAVMDGPSTAMVALLTAGADVEARYGVSEESALDIAACAGDVEQTKMLVRHGADVNAATSDGLTALHKAVGCKKLKLIGVLVGMGAIVDAQDVNGETPLITAAASETDSCEAMLALLQHGANTNARDTDMRTSLHRAARSTQWVKDFTRKVELLLEWDADEMAVDADGVTAVDQTRDMDFASGEPLRNEHDRYFSQSRLPERVRDLFAHAPAERRNRRWRRRRLLVLWRAHPNRFRGADRDCEVYLDKMEPRVLRSLVGEVLRSLVGEVRRSLVGDRRSKAASVGGWDGSGGGLDGVLAARVAGLEEEGIFRGVVMFL